ncbi:hypothetical protein E2C01_047589 [Portunus trituberculatus]|uniref:Uncharacterized protein n=1 Tax=Portunus trituberculatus TaxID=210409 RepID=A0A5B7G1I3_PORTR|nr:hypothetical protein [Portunus trituberculatus]
MREQCIKSRQKKTPLYDRPLFFITALCRGTHLA